MGARNSHLNPVIQTFTEGGENDRIRYAVSSRPDLRRNMKDAFAAVPDLDGLTSFFGVYDGHEGGEVALLCATQFHTELRNHPDYRDNLALAMQRTFFRMDTLLELSDDWRELLHHGWMQCFGLRGCICDLWPFVQRKPSTPYEPPQVSGSTACVAAIRGHQIVIGNVGRSRCIISRNGQATQLTTDHVPSNPIEKKRIETAGGLVTRNRVVAQPGEAEGFFLRQLLAGTDWINGILGHSRVIGDFAFKSNKDFPPEEQMATCDPEILTMGITNDIEFLVIVSDGICPLMKSQDVVRYIRMEFDRTTDLRLICERLCDRCVLSGDNATAILVQFKDAPPPPAPALPGNGGNNNAR